MGTLRNSFQSLHTKTYFPSSNDYPFVIWVPLKLESCVQVNNQHLKESVQLITVTMATVLRKRRLYFSLLSLVEVHALLLAGHPFI